MYILSSNATVFILAFSTLYLVVVVRRVANSRLGPEDAFLLSTLALVPIGYVLFPSYVSAITKLVGVTYPFFLMFGFFHFVSFVMIDRVLKLVTRHQKEITILSQEIALLRGELDSLSQLLNSRDSATANRGHD
jgi:hypothetical protein